MASTRPGIDIAVPNYNYGRFLPDCLGSILSQSHGDLRVLVIDNASTDDSVAVVERMARTDSRIQLRVHERNRGPHASFNAGIDWAEADYFAILCSDDIFTPGALQRAIAAMEADREVAIAYGATSFFSHTPSGAEDVCTGRAETMAGGDFIAAFCRHGRTLIDGPTAIVRTAAQKAAGHYRSDLPHTDDVEMWLRLGLRGKAARIDAVQVAARLHADNQSGALRTVHHWNVEMERAFDAFFTGAGRSMPEASHLHAMATRRLAERAYWCAASHLMRGEPDVAALLHFAFTRRPLFALLPPLGAIMRRDDAGERIRRTMQALARRFRLRSAT